MRRKMKKRGRPVEQGLVRAKTLEKWATYTLFTSVNVVCEEHILKQP